MTHYRTNDRIKAQHLFGLLPGLEEGKVVKLPCGCVFAMLPGLCHMAIDISVWGL
jgi:hypothetical protein